MPTVWQKVADYCLIAGAGVAGTLAFFYTALTFLGARVSWFLDRHTIYYTPCSKHNTEPQCFVKDCAEFNDSENVVYNGLKPTNSKKINGLREYDIFEQLKDGKNSGTTYQIQKAKVVKVIERSKPTKEIEEQEGVTEEGFFYPKCMERLWDSAKSPSPNFHIFFRRLE